MLGSAGDQELLTRQAALQAEATEVLAELDLGALFADVGPVLVVGSYVSGLMCWRDLDVCLLAGAEFSPADVLELLKRVVELPGLVGFTYRDERGQRSPTGAARDERYHELPPKAAQEPTWFGGDGCTVTRQVSEPALACGDEPGDLAASAGHGVGEHRRSNRPGRP